jgi:putative ABC transport system ATP-binding protein
MLINISDLILRRGSGEGALTVLDIPLWAVDGGERVAVTGPSGSGKSTLLNVIAGLLTPGGGTVRVAGEDLAAMGEAARDRFRAANISYIFQTFNLLQGYTALENVLMGAAFFPGPRPGRGRAKELLERVGLKNRMRRKPSELSIGEQQRVAIARALVKEPKLILADEPTGSLDPRLSAGVVTLLREASREHGCALIMVSHETAAVSLFERRVDFLRLNRAFAGTEEARA